MVCAEACMQRLFILQIKKIQRPFCTAFVKTELVASELYKSIIYVCFLFSKHKLQKSVAQLMGFFMVNLSIQVQSL